MVFLWNFLWNTNQILRTGADSDVGLILLDFLQVWQGDAFQEMKVKSLSNLGGMIFLNFTLNIIRNNFVSEDVNFFYKQSSQKYLLQKHTVSMLVEAEYGTSGKYSIWIKLRFCWISSIFCFWSKISALLWKLGSRNMPFHNTRKVDILDWIVKAILCKSIKEGAPSVLVTATPLG